MENQTTSDSPDQISSVSNSPVNTMRERMDDEDENSGGQAAVFLRSENHSEIIAEEIEVETSSVGVCCENDEIDGDMVYTCEITLTLSPSSSPRFEDPPESEWLVVKIHHSDPSDGTVRYKCRNCDGVVEQRSTKQKFQLNVTRLRFKCKYCPRRYMTKLQLRTHLLRHNEKKKVCPFCDKRFLTRNELRNHLNTHTRQKPFRCPCCFQRFAHSSRYYSHIRNIHKKYECNTCFSKVCLTGTCP